jgi:hypothetical protein
VYEEENRVVEVKRHGDSATLAEYEYDALGRRVHTIEHVDASTGAGLTTPKKTRHVYVGLETVEEYQITGQPSEETATLLREFVWGDPSSFPEPLAMVAHGGTSGGQGGPEIAGDTILISRTELPEIGMMSPELVLRDPERPAQRRGKADKYEVGDHTIETQDPHRLSRAHVGIRLSGEESQSIKERTRASALHTRTARLRSERASCSLPVRRAAE